MTLGVIMKMHWWDYRFVAGLFNETTLRCTLIRGRGQEEILKEKKLFKGKVFYGGHSFNTVGIVNQYFNTVLKTFTKFDTNFSFVWSEI